ncbi:TetR family transcriptional regulator [Streptomyces sp. NA02950]|uniref:TetR/AcrR family transcriptional regulator n=1 Tax=Streptomyces sp. NA02950 TaxID=2742137 RepID=UPI00159054F5|nr:TetR family transcriptional regulator [Streptomyces sp. NA02950]QKV92839.1 TetR family transcriptional regulator [Streptomyces sp. NA02950]
MARTTSAAERSARRTAPGLRERKKIKTRRAIRQAAYRLFAERGYDATPVDRIAEAADVSPSTVFRYFPTKEDIVLTDEYDVILAAAIRDRPLDESPVTALRRAILDLLGQFTAAERKELLTRLALVRRIPALRARMGEGLATTAVTLGEAMAERGGRAPDDFEVRIVAGAILGALQEAVFHCLDHRRVEDMEATIDHALALLSRGLPL